MQLPVLVPVKKALLRGFAPLRVTLPFARSAVIFLSVVICVNPWLQKPFLAPLRLCAIPSFFLFLAQA
jgi:hypothetical protein